MDKEKRQYCLNDITPIRISSVVGEDENGGLIPLVQWQQGQYSGLWNAYDALRMAVQLLIATSTSVNEGNIMLVLLDHMGVEQSDPDIQIKKANILRLIRAARCDLSGLVNPVFGKNEDRPLVEINWYKSLRVVSIQGAIEEAEMIIGASNASINDLIARQTLKDMGFDLDTINVFFEKMRENRLLLNEKFEVELNVAYGEDVD